METQPIPIPVKYCTKCQTTKPLTEFHFQNEQQGTRLSTCKTCRREYQRQYNPENTESRREYQKQHHTNNKDKINEKQRQRYRTDLNYRISCQLRNV